MTTTDRRDRRDAPTPDDPPYHPDDDDGVRDRTDDVRALRALVTALARRLVRVTTSPDAPDPAPLVLGDPTDPARVVVTLTAAELVTAELVYATRITVVEGFGGPSTVPVTVELTRVADRPGPTSPPRAATAPRPVVTVPLPDPTDPTDPGADR